MKLIAIAALIIAVAAIETPPQDDHYYTCTRYPEPGVCEQHDHTSEPTGKNQACRGAKRCNTEGNGCIWNRERSNGISYANCS
ncbi:hypothetical protein E6O75_ATG08649 [Venturia nashicola]|uniref:Uncharacterized protein n=1 Tax=Venturia nashicola TaxID=86259 RepID=A0A4Z1NGB4_9PEZI|nr:hypothetical protein E6O75_ATG08649 [Venturia nashicola]